MIIVLEGPDFSGKTTVANKIVSRLEMIGTVARLHCGPPDARPIMHQYIKPIEELESAETPPDFIVCDRWHWGEVIYGPVYRKVSRLPLGYFRFVDLFLNARRIEFAYFNLPTHELRRRASRGDDYINIDDLEEISMRYSSARAGTALDRIHDLTGPTSVGTFVGRMTHPATTARRHSTHRPILDVTKYPSFVGSPYCRHLLVGYQANPNSGTKAAFTPYAAGSGSVIASVLAEMTPAMVQSVGIINSGDGEVEAIAQRHEEQAFVSIIACGAAAAVRLRAAGVPHERVAHPAYVRRFGGRGGTRWYTNDIINRMKEDTA